MTDQRLFEQFVPPWRRWVDERLAIWSHLHVSGLLLGQGDDWGCVTAEVVLADSGVCQSPAGIAVHIRGDICAFRVPVPVTALGGFIEGLGVGEWPAGLIPGVPGRIRFNLVEGKRFEPQGEARLEAPNMGPEVPQSYGRWPRYALELRGPASHEWLGQQRYQWIEALDRRLMGTGNPGLSELGSLFGTFIGATHVSSFWNLQMAVRLVAPVICRMNQTRWNAQRGEFAALLEIGHLIPRDRVQVLLHDPYKLGLRPPVQIPGGSNSKVEVVLGRDQPGDRGEVRVLFFDEVLQTERAGPGIFSSHGLFANLKERVFDEPDEGVDLDGPGGVTPPTALRTSASPARSTSSDGNSITELTRRDLSDLLADSWSGRLSQIEFLRRLYHLERLPSHDQRFASMDQDVAQHTEANNDWPSSWVFEDDRLGLSDDEILLRFVAETVHPGVVDPSLDVSSRIREINRILLPDGFELVVSGALSKRPTYAARRTVPRLPPTGRFSGPLISGIAQALAKGYSHTHIDSLFEDQDFPRPRDFGTNKVDKVKAWLRAADQDEKFDHWAGVGGVLGVVLDVEAQDGSDRAAAQQELRALLARLQIAHLPGGTLTAAPELASASSAHGLPGGQLPPLAEWRQLGQGGFGTVYAMRDAHLEVDFAIKVFDPSPFNVGADARPRFLREAGLLFKLRHESIIRIFEAGTLGDGRPYIKMELFDGGTLQSLLDARRLTVEESVLVIGRLAGALEHAHAQAIYHRDLKPTNVLVNGGLDQVRLIDFGLAILVEEAVARTRLTTSAHQFGSAYSAPELLENAKEVGPHLDVYSLGAIWFRIVGGRAPQGAGIDQAIEACELDRSLKLLLRRCLSAKGDRPAVKEVLTALRDWHRARTATKRSP